MTTDELLTNTGLSVQSSIGQKNTGNSHVSVTEHNCLYLGKLHCTGSVEPCLAQVQF